MKRRHLALMLIVMGIIAAGYIAGIGTKKRFREKHHKRRVVATPRSEFESESIA